MSEKIPVAVVEAVAEDYEAHEVKDLNNKWKLIYTQNEMSLKNLFNEIIEQFGKKYKNIIIAPRSESKLFEEKNIYFIDDDYFFYPKDMTDDEWYDKKLKFTNDKIIKPEILDFLRKEAIEYSVNNRQTYYYGCYCCCVDKIYYPIWYLTIKIKD